MFGKLFGRDKHVEVVAPAPLMRESFDFFAPAESRFVIPDWQRVEESLASRLAAEDPHELWCKVAHAWMRTFAETLGAGFAVAESKNFLLVSPKDERANRVFLEYAERTLKRIMLLLDGIGDDKGYGYFCVIAFANDDQYYEYVANYYPDEGEYAMSSGMYLQYGYGHFVCTSSDMRNLEPIIAHELTHALLAHLPIPAWLNEGLAVNTEKILAGRGHSEYTPRELVDMHRAFWNRETIQEFWSGKSFLRADDGNLLSYDLAKHMATMLSREKQAFINFANAADLSDSGQAAAEKHLGISLASAAQVLLGEGDWQPYPSRWLGEAERGAF